MSAATAAAGPGAHVDSTAVISAIPASMVVAPCDDADDAAGDGMLALVLVAHEKIDRLALIQRKQQALRDRVCAVALLEHLKWKVAAGIAQHDRVRLEARGHTGKRDCVLARL